MYFSLVVYWLLLAEIFSNNSYVGGTTYNPTDISAPLYIKAKVLFHLQLDYQRTHFCGGLYLGKYLHTLLMPYISLFIHSLVFSLRGRAGRNQSPVMWPVWLLGKFLGVVCHCLPPPLDVPTFAARCLYVRNDVRDPSSKRRKCREKLSTNFRLNSDFHVNLGIFYMPQIYDMGPTALFPFRGKACWEFLRPIKSDGFGRYLIIVGK